MQDTVKNEPAGHLNDSTVLANCAREYAQPLSLGIVNMPAVYQGAPMLAGSALVPFGLQWKIPGIDESTRKTIALNTCSGCHLSETKTPFPHVMATEVQALLRKLPIPTVRQPAILSKFLQAELSGPRVLDFQILLSEGKDNNKIKNGPGLDHNDDED